MTYTLITGASSGIGMEMARLFAADGHHLVLAARRQEKLKRLADNLNSTFGVETHVVATDLSDPDSVQCLCETVQASRWKINTLVNNAGFGAVGNFATINASRQTDMIAVNVMALTVLTRQFLPAMIQGNSGGVLNVASVAAYQPGPYMAVYYATKAYVLSFSEALREELRGTGVNVTCLAPGPTKSEFGTVSGLDRFRFFTNGALSAEQVARAGHRGFKRCKATVVPGLRNRIMVNIVKHLPHWFTSRIVAQIQHPQASFSTTDGNAPNS